MHAFGHLNILPIAQTTRTTRISDLFNKIITLHRSPGSYLVTRCFSHSESSFSPMNYFDLSRLRLILPELILPSSHITSYSTLLIKLSYADFLPSSSLSDASSPSGSLSMHTSCFTRVLFCQALHTLDALSSSAPFL